MVIVGWAKRRMPRGPTLRRAAEVVRRNRFFATEGAEAAEARWRGVIVGWAKRRMPRGPTLRHCRGYASRWTDGAVHYFCYD